jgi:hypothetical protein
VLWGIAEASDVVALQDKKQAAEISLLLSSACSCLFCAVPLNLISLLQGIPPHCSKQSNLSLEAVDGALAADMEKGSAC